MKINKRRLNLVNVTNLSQIIKILFTDLSLPWKRVALRNSYANIEQALKYELKLTL